MPDWIGTLRLDNIPLMGGQLAVEVVGEVVRALAGARRPHDRLRPAVPDAASASPTSGAVGGPAARAKSPSGSVHHRASCSPAASSSSTTCSRVNFALTSVRISSPAANGTASVERTHVHGVRVDRAEAHLDLAEVLLEHGDVLEAAFVEVGVELAVHHRAARSC